MQWLSVIQLLPPKLNELPSATQTARLQSPGRHRIVGNGLTAIPVHAGSKQSRDDHAGYEGVLPHTRDPTAALLPYLWGGIFTSERL